MYTAAGGQIQYIDFDKRQSKLLMQRRAGINKFNVYLKDDGDLGFDAWGGLTGVQKIDSMASFVADPHAFKDLKMIRLDEW